LLKNIKENVNLSNYSTFKIGGNASMFYSVTNIKELRNIIKLCKKGNIEYKIIGNGSNILFPSEDFKGLVIHFSEKFSKITQKKNVFYVESGTQLSKFIIESVNQGYQGYEKLIGIPATVGGAINSNAGANGVSICDHLFSVTCLIDNKIRTIKTNKISFDYRNSFFKNKDVVILNAKFKLKKGDKESLLSIIREERKKRKKSMPLKPNIGCIFKNVGDLSAGKIIEECGLKGTCIGGVRISEKHANIIENYNKGTSNDVKNLIELIKKDVYEKKKIVLEEEIIIW